MSSKDDRDLDELRSLPRTAAPPPAIEERVIGALRARRLIVERPASRPRLRDRPHMRGLALAASLVIAVLAGWLARGLYEPAATPFPARERQYLVLLSEPSGLATEKPIPELVAEYRDWALALAERGHLVSGARLEHHGVRLASDRGGDIYRRDADWRQATGYFVIRASSYDQAAALVADCPHLAYGGEISLRQLANGA